MTSRPPITAPLQLQPQRRLHLRPGGLLLGAEQHGHVHHQFVVGLHQSQLSIGASRPIRGEYCLHVLVLEALDEVLPAEAGAELVHLRDPPLRVLGIRGVA